MKVIQVMKNKVCQCNWERRVVDICLLRPATTTQLIVEVMKVVDVGLKRPDNLSQVIKEVVDVGQC